MPKARKQRVNATWQQYILRQEARGVPKHRLEELLLKNGYGVLPIYGLLYAAHGVSPSTLDQAAYRPAVPAAPPTEAANAGTAPSEGSGSGGDELLVLSSDDDADK